MNSLLLLSMACAFSITYLLIPSIINIADRKKIFDEPGGRKTHKRPIPALGGIAIFAGFLIALLLFMEINFQTNMRSLTAAATMLVLVGIKDDLIGISALQKLFFQWIIVSLLFQLGFSFDGVFDLSWAGPLVAPLNYGLTCFFLLGLINAYNLIDGVDGLAGSLGVWSCLAFGGLFYTFGFDNLCLVCLSLAGALLAFLRFNFHQAKIFMGDTGSMLIGLMCGIFSLLLLRLDLPQSAHTSLLPVAYAIIAVPVVDLLRVFVCRMLQGHSPFKADRIHIHHLLGNIGFHSVKICLLLLAFQFCLFLVALQLLPLLSWFAALSVLFICTLAFLLGVQWLHHLKEKKSAPLTYKQSIK